MSEISEQDQNSGCPFSNTLRAQPNEESISYSEEHAAYLGYVKGLAHYLLLGT